MLHISHYWVAGFQCRLAGSCKPSSARCVPSPSVSALYRNLPFCQVCAGTSELACMGGASGVCQVGAGLPAPRHLQFYNWWRVKQYERWLLMVQVDRVTERSGPICCYR